MTSQEPPAFFIVGASSGIGAELARQCAAKGFRLVLSGRDQERLDAVGRETGAATLSLEARDSAAVDAAFDQALARLGRLDGVVNCAGSILLKPAHALSDADFADTLALNLVTAFNVLRAAARVMLRQPEGGSIVLCSSAAARRGLIHHEAIAAAKAGVEGLALAAAASYARSKIRVNCVAPGLTRTPLARKLTELPAAERASAALHPLGRIGEAGEVAAAIAWLLDPGQAWITGQVLGVDGGLASIQARP
ncbi:MAG: hypothetical protein RL095_697 [Verrucomicrobiota bacterium]|jgi:NAD(P)-dependent dehydrogenase (short-subunit alcohol dehydrogenase family)